MRMKYQDGVIYVRLTKPVTAKLQKALDECKQLSVMSPLRDGINAAAATAAAALTTLLAMIGNDAEEVMPLLDGQVKPGTPVQVETPSDQTANDPPPAIETHTVEMDTPADPAPAATEETAAPKKGRKNGK